MDYQAWRDKAGSTISRLQGTMHKTVKGWYRLKDFIRLVRKAKTKAEERALMSKEAATIRTALKSEKCASDERWHSIAKLLFLHLSGYPVHSYGQVDCIKLIAAASAAGADITGITKGRSRTGAKRLGYFGATLLLDDRQQTLFLLTNTLKQDLTGHGHPIWVKSALGCLVSVTNEELYMELAGPVIDLITDQKAGGNAGVKSRAAICLAVMAGRMDEVVDMIPEGLPERLLPEKDFSSQLAACYLIEASEDSLSAEARERLAGYISRQLNSTSSDSDPLAPATLQVSRLRTIRKLGSSAPEVVENVVRFINGLPVLKRYCGFAVLAEALRTLISLVSGQKNSDHVSLISDRIGELLASEEANIKYVGFSLLTLVKESFNQTSMLKIIAKYRGVVLQTIVKASQEDPVIVSQAIGIALGLIVDKNTFKIVAEQILKCDRDDLAGFEEEYGFALLDSMNKHYGDEMKQYPAMVFQFLNKFAFEDTRRREQIVYRVIKQLSKSTRYSLDVPYDTLAAKEVYMWTLGNNNQPLFEKEAKKFLRDGSFVRDPISLGYLITAARKTNCVNILESLLKRRDISLDCKELIQKHIYLMQRAPYSTEKQEDILEEEDLEEGEVESPSATNSTVWGRLVFEGEGILIYMKRADGDGEEEKLMFEITMVNPSKHVAFLTKNVSMQVAVRKGHGRVELESPSSDQIPPFSTNPIHQTMRIVDLPDHLNIKDVVRMRCRVKYTPGDRQEEVVDTFEVCL